jgi:hypothetical protein
MESALERSQNELEILWLLARGEEEIEAGKGYDLDTILVEADALLEEMQRQKPVSLLMKPRVPDATKRDAYGM